MKLACRTGGAEEAPGSAMLARDSATLGLGGSAGVGWSMRTHCKQEASMDKDRAYCSST